MILNRGEYLSKVMGCWMGKNIGGTLGAPMEWRRQVNNVSFYTQELGGEPLPNDDLDIQLLWLVAMERHGVDINARLLGEFWCMYVTPHWAEYGNAKVNLRRGLVPPLSAMVHNPYKDSCGSFIRCEIWACIAPGQPRTAAKFAYEDSILDHGDGEGTYAELFCAALESAAFVEKDIDKLLDIGLTYIPATCAVAKAAQEARACHKAGKTWLQARDNILEKYRGSSAFNDPACTSPDDHKKGFGTGKLGFDVASNIGIIVIGLLYGQGDFGKTICTAVNCGEDTDCTGATVGSIFGIMHGIESIPEKWITPIGRSIKTIVLDLGDVGGQIAKDVDDLTRRTERIAQQVLLRHRLPLAIDDRPTDLAGVTPETLSAGGWKAAYGNWRGPVYSFDFFDVAIDYGGEAMIRNGQPKTIRVTIHNTLGMQATLNLRWLLPAGWRISPSAEGSVMSVTRRWEEPPCLEFTLTADQVTQPTNRAVLEITADGRPTCMLVPIVLLNGNYEKPQV
ncbi:MAG: ADP-ribosylglycohydrolase family protein [Phycisphaerae bacterium]